MKVKLVAISYIVLTQTPLLHCQVIESSCFGEGQQFTLIGQDLNFESAVTACENIGATLASVVDLDEYNIVINELADEIDGNVWIGLRRPDDTGLVGTDPLEFTFTDGTQDQTFYQSRNTLPWGNGQPNNANDGQPCVEWRFDNGVLDGFWNDFRCDIEQPFLCKVPCTLTPTNNPSTTPTRNPTKAPTEGPPRACSNRPIGILR